MLTHWCIRVELALHLLAEISCLLHRNSYLGIWGYYWVKWDLNRTISTVLSIIHLSFNVICIMANANLFGILVILPSRAAYLADCNLYVVKDRSQTSSIVSFKLWKLNYCLVMEVSNTCVLCSHRFKIIDCLSLSSIPFQGLPLLGKLHSLDITRRIGSLIWSSLTLNVIHSGQLEAWTFFVRDLTDQDFQSNHTKTAREGSAWKAQLQQ